MTQISADLVRQLREMTGAPMMDTKRNTSARVSSVVRGGTARPVVGPVVMATTLRTNRPTGKVQSPRRWTGTCRDRSLTDQSFAGLDWESSSASVLIWSANSTLDWMYRTSIP